MMHATPGLSPQAALAEAKRSCSTDILAFLKIRTKPRFTISQRIASEQPAP